MATTFRVDFRAGLYSILVTVKAANPFSASTGEGLNEIANYPPESYNTPIAFVAKAMPETADHMSGVRQRVLRGVIVVITKLISNAQTAAEQDKLVDLLVDAITAAPHAASGSTLIEYDGVTEGEISDPNGGTYSAAYIAVKGAIAEGRP